MRGSLAALLVIVHLPAWWMQPSLALRTHAIHGAIQAVRVATPGAMGTHDIGLASWGATHPVVDLLGLSDVRILEGWLRGDPMPAIEEQLAEHGAHLTIGLEAFFDVDPPGWTRVATLEPGPGMDVAIVERLVVYAVRPEWAVEVREVLERADLDGRRVVVFHEP